MADQDDNGVELPDLNLLHKFDIPAPRYTSYPTADRFNSALTRGDYEEALRGRAVEAVQKALSLYVHIPFCSDVCYYCGCNKIVTRDHGRAAEYLDAVEKEASLVKSFITGDTALEQLHFGGGSPTFLEDGELERVMNLITSRFPLKAGGEFSIEVDPRSCPPAKVEKLASLGLNRMSLGVQDLDPAVQKAVNRVQPHEMVKETLDAARRCGFHSINMDLIYGLPLQTRESFAKTIEHVISLSPDRIALYHYAHLPNHFKPQRMIRNADLPSTETKVGIMFDSIRTLTANGYRYIGMDHFAKDTDELSIAQRNGTLQRNFQGYSTRADCDMVALGCSSISKVGRIYACNPREAEPYYEPIRKGQLATMRGFRLSDEDLMRHWIIMRIMCQFEVKKSDVESRFGVDFDREFAWEMKHLASYERHELVRLTPEGIFVCPKGKIFVRAVAMQFDRYLRESTRTGGYSTIA